MSVAPSNLPGSTTADVSSLLEQLFGFIRLSAKRLNYSRMGDAEEEIPAAGLRVLDSLLDSGPQTVPQLARQWSTSRQNLQIIINRLQKAKLVELQPNPAHKRSGLFRLTSAGEQAATRMSTRNSSLLAYLTPKFGEAEVKSACEVMDRLGEAIRAYCAECQRVPEPPEQSSSPAEAAPARGFSAAPAEEMPVNLL